MVLELALGFGTRWYCRRLTWIDCLTRLRSRLAGTTFQLNQ